MGHQRWHFLRHCTVVVYLYFVILLSLHPAETCNVEKLPVMRLWALVFTNAVDLRIRVNITDNFIVHVHCTISREEYYCIYFYSLLYFNLAYNTMLLSGGGIFCQIFRQIMLKQLNGSGCFWIDGYLLSGPCQKGIKMTVTAWRSRRNNAASIIFISNSEPLFWLFRHTKGDRRF